MAALAARITSPRRRRRLRNRRIERDATHTVCDVGDCCLLSTTSRDRVMEHCLPVSSHPQDCLIQWDRQAVRLLHGLATGLWRHRRQRGTLISHFWARTPFPALKGEKNVPCLICPQVWRCPPPLNPFWPFNRSGIIALYCFATHRIWSIWPPLTYLLQNWKKNHEKMEMYWLRWCYLDHKWLAGGPKSRILLQWHTGFGESLDQVHFCRRGLCWKVTKYHAHILLLTVSGYELFERPSYMSP